MQTCYATPVHLSCDDRSRGYHCTKCPLHGHSTHDLLIDIWLYVFELNINAHPNTDQSCLRHEYTSCHVIPLVIIQSPLTKDKKQ